MVSNPQLAELHRRHPRLRLRNLVMEHPLSHRRREEFHSLPRPLRKEVPPRHPLLRKVIRSLFGRGTTYRKAVWIQHRYSPLLLPHRPRQG